MEGQNRNEEEINKDLNWVHVIRACKQILLMISDYEINKRENDLLYELELIKKH